MNRLIYQHRRIFNKEKIDSFEIYKIIDSLEDPNLFKIVAIDMPECLFKHFGCRKRLHGSDIRHNKYLDDSNIIILYQEIPLDYPIDALTITENNLLRVFKWV